MTAAEVAERSYKTWSRRAKPHYHVIYKCGCLKARCACKPRLFERITGVDQSLCPACQAFVDSFTFPEEARNGPALPHRHPLEDVRGVRRQAARLHA